MSVIPIDPNSMVVHTDESGNEFHFRYLTGEYRTKFTKVQGVIADAAKPYIEQAKRALGKKAKGTDVMTKAIKLAKDAGRITAEMEDVETAGTIDLVLSGWKGKGFPVIKKGTKPSDYLTSVQLSEIMIMATQYIEQLIGLTIEDQKN